MLLRQIFDPRLAQYAYLIGCQATGEAIVIDPERDIDRYIDAAEAEGLRLTAVAETHIHADFLSGARELAERLGVKVYVSAEGGPDWQVEWAKAYPKATLLRDGDSFRVGNIELKAVHTPGHTPEHLSYLVTDHGGGAKDAMGIVTGDFVFVGDLGRPDLLEQAAGIQGAQEASAHQLYGSLGSFLELEDHLQVWPGHGAGSACGKALGAVPVTTVGYERRHNAALDAAGAGEDAFVEAILADQPEPPLYVANMKALNRSGPPILGDLPRPHRAALQEIGSLVADAEVAIVDTRTPRSAFMARHLPGSLHAPLDRAFNTVVGSLVEDPTRPILLVVEADRVEDAVRDLVRIGYDSFAGFVDEDLLEDWFAEGGPGSTILEIDTARMGELFDLPGHVVVDVRTGAEYRAGHAPGAVHVPYTRLPSLEDRIPKGQTLLVHCGSGKRSAAAASYLAAKGYDVRFVDDSWTGWVRSGRAVERGEPAETALQPVATRFKALAEPTRARG
jgi:hydroxyacylglutathione hydrolase